MGGGSAGLWALGSESRAATEGSTPVAMDRVHREVTGDLVDGIDRTRSEQLDRRAKRAARDTVRDRPKLREHGTPLPTETPEESSGGGSAPSGSPKAMARAMLSDFGWSAGSQFSCLDRLWEKESGWDPDAENAQSGAYGIPQALPGSKMAIAGSDWRINPATQIEWGLGYIEDRYSSPCDAWSHSQSNGWY